MMSKPAIYRVEMYPLSFFSGDCGLLLFRKSDQSEIEAFGRTIQKSAFHKGNNRLTLSLACLRQCSYKGSVPKKFQWTYIQTDDEFKHVTRSCISIWETDGIGMLERKDSSVVIINSSNFKEVDLDPLLRFRLIKAAELFKRLEVADILGDQLETTNLEG